MEFKENKAKVKLAPLQFSSVGNITFKTRTGGKF